MRKPFISYRRGSKWYVAFWDYDRREYSVRKSGAELVVSLGDRAKHLLRTAHTRAAAEEAAQIAVDTDARHASTELLGSYLESFWDNEGAYAQACAARGHRLSAEYLLGSRSAIERHVLPYLKKRHLDGLALARVTPGHLEELILHLHKTSGLSAQRINGIRQAIARPLAEAERLGKISINPARRVPRIAGPKRTRDILTRKEAALVLAKIQDPRVRLLNTLAATTGMRLGECLGLQVEDLSSEGDILVRHNWQPAEGDKSPKAGSIRTVPVPTRVMMALRELGAQNPWGTPWVFWGSQPKRPLSERIVQTAYVDAVHDAGIPEEERRNRGLTFHAWRHWYRSQLDAAGLSARAGDALTGHRTEEVGSRYTHPTDEQREAVKKIGHGLEKVLLVS